MWKIRNASLQDAERLAEIYAYYVRNTAITFEYTEPTAEEFRKRMEHIMERYPYLVLEEEGTILGYAYAGTFNVREAYDWSCETTIYLDHDARGRGLGRKLYEALEQALSEMGICNLYACIGSPVIEDESLTHASERFHERFGFRLCGTFEKCGYKFGRWYNMVWMEKIIGEHRETMDPIRNHPYK